MAYTQTRNQLLTTAIKIAKQVTDGVSPSATDFEDAVDCLQRIVEDLNNEGIILSQTELIRKTLTASSEVTGSDGKIYTCIKSHTSSSTTVPVTGANYLSYWIEKGSIGGVHTLVTNYTAIGEIVLDTDTVNVELAYIRENNDDNGLMEALSFDKYHDIVDKHSNGLPFSYYVDYQVSPRMYLYYQPDKTTYIVNYLKTKKIASMDTATQVIDLEKRWYNYLVYQTASLFADMKNLDLSNRNWIKGRAKEFFNTATKKDFYRNPNNMSEGSY